MMGRSGTGDMVGMLARGTQSAVVAPHSGHAYRPRSMSGSLAAWRAAVQREFALHLLLMRFSYAMTFGAVTLRLQIPIGFALGSTTQVTTYASTGVGKTAEPPNSACSRRRPAQFMRRRG